VDRKVGSALERATLKSGTTGRLSSRRRVRKGTLLVASRFEKRHGRTRGNSFGAAGTGGLLLEWALALGAPTGTVNPATSVGQRGDACN